MSFDKSNYNRSISTPQKRLELLATPRCRNFNCLPDKPSIYWLDYIIDPTPHTIKDPIILLQYYEQLQSKLPRLNQLAQPKPYYGQYYSFPRRPSTSCGIPKSALQYTPSERIKKLALPKALELEIKPPQAQGSKPPWSPWRSGIIDSSTRIDLGAGDYFNRSMHRMEFRTREIQDNPNSSQKIRRKQTCTTGNKVYANRIVGSSKSMESLLMDQSYTVSQKNLQNDQEMGDCSNVSHDNRGNSEEFRVQVRI